MREFAIAAAFVLAMVMGPVRLASATVYTFTLTGPVSGSGMLTTSAPDNGGFNVIAITGSIGGEAITGLVGGNPGIPTLSPSGLFTYDNILFATQDPLLDDLGILFSLTSHSEANIYGVGASDYGYYNQAGGSYDAQMSAGERLSIVIIPEPASLALMGTGLLAMGLMLRLRRPQT